MENGNSVITDDGSGEWIVIDNDDIYAIRFFTEENHVTPRWTSSVLSEGNRSLTTGSYLYLCTKAALNQVFDGNAMIELWNGGDELGNGAVTFKVGNTEIAMNSNTGAQVEVKDKSSYAVYAKANWYNGSYFLRVIKWE